MRTVAKTLHLATQGTTARLDSDAVRIERPGERFVRVPLRSIDMIIVYGHITLTTELLTRAAVDRVGIAYLTRGGRFVASVRGPTSGNVLLRKAQFRAIDDRRTTVEIARIIVGAKLLNSRVVLLDAAKDRDLMKAEALRCAAADLEALAREAVAETDLDCLRGIEGRGAISYFGELGTLSSDPTFHFSARTRRPARDPMNALMSFLYALLRVRCVGGLEAVGLDPQAGFLHSLRPGRPSLALDVMEELRAPFADRHALTLVNRRQLGPMHFVERLGGSYELTDDGRRTVLETWEAFLDSTITHRVFGSTATRRSVPQLQALLLARHLRGDLDAYLPFRTVGR